MHDSYELVLYKDMKGIIKNDEIHMSKKVTRDIIIIHIQLFLEIRNQANLATQSAASSKAHIKRKNRANENPIAQRDPHAPLYNTSARKSASAADNYTMGNSICELSFIRSPGVSSADEEIS